MADVRPEGVTKVRGCPDRAEINLTIFHGEFVVFSSIRTG